MPKTFVYALKGSRFITHMKKLANLDEPVKRPRYPNARIVRAPQNAKMLMQMVGEFSIEPEDREIQVQPRRVLGKTLERKRRSLGKRAKKQPAA